MAFKVKLDEALSGLLAASLRKRGYEVRTVLDQNWGGLKDPVLWPRILAEEVFFITTDKAFGDIRKHRPGTHPGILLLRPDRESLYAYQELLERVLEKHKLQELAGTVSVATSAGVRIRRPES